MSAHPDVSSGSHVPQAIAPIRPATSPKTAPATSTPATLLRRTLGGKFPSRRTLGNTPAPAAAAGQGYPGGTPTHRHPIYTRLAMLAAPVLAVLTLGLAAGPASAAVATAPNPYASWSPRIPPQEWDGYFGSDCTIKAGPVWDTQNTGGQFAAIGGGTLYCQTLHTYTITVTEYFAHPGGYYSAQPGTRSYSATNYGTNGILQTGRLCGTGRWYTAVQVAAAGYTPALVFKSNPAYVAATLGC